MKVKHQLLFYPSINLSITFVFQAHRPRRHLQGDVGAGVGQDRHPLQDPLARPPLAALLDRLLRWRNGAVPRRQGGLAARRRCRRLRVGGRLAQRGARQGREGQGLRHVVPRHEEGRRKGNMHAVP